MCDGSPTNHEASGAEVFYAVEKGFGLILSERNMVLGSVVVDQLSYFKTANDPQHIWVYNRAFKTISRSCVLDIERTGDCVSSNSRWCSASAAASTWSGDTGVLGRRVHTFYTEKAGNPRAFYKARMSLVGKT